jgi:hypothetical protein
MRGREVDALHQLTLAFDETTWKQAASPHVLRLSALT